MVTDKSNRRSRYSKFNLLINSRAVLELAMSTVGCLSHIREKPTDSYPDPTTHILGLGPLLHHSDYAKDNYKKKARIMERSKKNKREREKEKSSVTEKEEVDLLLPSTQYPQPSTQPTAP